MQYINVQAILQLKYLRIYMIGNVAKKANV